MRSGPDANGPRSAVGKDTGIGDSGTSGRSLSPLFAPLKVKHLTLPNRFVMPAMQRGWCQDGEPLPRLADYYRQRVEGGVGLIIGEASAIDHASSTGQPPAASMFGPALAGWGRCVRAVKAAGGAMLLQLWHEGAMRTAGLGGADPGAPSLSPSGLVWDGRANGSAATRAELAAIKAAFVRAACAAQDLGADGVELHGAHGFLLDQFLWAETNRRTDGLGGRRLAARLSYPVEVVAAVREAVGPQFVIGWRFSQWKEVDFDARVARTPAQLGVILGALRQAGVDLFHASTRRFDRPEWPGSERGLAGWAKSLTDAPVIAIGGVGVAGDLIETEEKPTEPWSIEAQLERLGRRFDAGEFDLVAAGRALIGDAQWVEKVRTGRLDQITPFSRELLDEVGWDVSLMMEGLSRPPRRAGQPKGDAH